jgi:hypothetical protein
MLTTKTALALLFIISISSTWYYCKGRDNVLVLGLFGHRDVIDEVHGRSFLGHLLGADEHLRKLETLSVAFVGILELDVDGYHPLRAEHLQLDVGVVGDRHELHLRRPSKDRGVHSREADHLEGECLLVEIPLITEGDR